MNSYLLLKYLHILSSVALVGIGFGSAFYLFFIHRSRNLAAIAIVSKMVVRADYWFTSPTVIIQPLSGIGMIYLGGWHYDDLWLLASYLLFILAGICWLPVVWLQIKMAAMAEHALASNKELPARYWQYAHYWTILGTLAFPMMLVVYGLMVFKPS